MVITAFIKVSCHAGDGLVSTCDRNRDREILGLVQWLLCDVSELKSEVLAP